MHEDHILQVSAKQMLQNLGRQHLSPRRYLACAAGDAARAVEIGQAARQ